MRVLIAAENASMQKGGEAALPYHYFRLLRARGIDAHLVVHARVRTELTALLPDEVEFMHFAEDMALQKVLYRLGSLLPRRVDEATLGLTTQILTQWGQRKLLRQLATANSVIHQPIPVAPRFPSMLHGLGSPVVIGPLNGGMAYPPGLHMRESFVSRAVIALARRLSDVGNAIFPGKRKAAVVLVANERTKASLPSGIDGQVIKLSENAADPAQWRNDAISPDTNCATRFVFIGRLVDWKALDIVIDALREVEGAHLDVVGDGPMLHTWKARAVTMGVRDRIHFHGWLSQRECALHLRKAWALVLPSISECGGAVVLEAMAMAKPAIATAWGGPIDYLDAACGILIQPVNREAMVIGFRDAMRRLQASPELCTRLGVAGRQRMIREFNWDRKIDRILEIYANAIERHGEAGP